VRILWVSHTAWEVPQRAHLFCRALAEHHDVHVAESTAGFAGPLDYLSRGYLRNLTYRTYRDGQIKIHHIPRFSPALFAPPLRRLNNSIFARLAARIIRRERIDCVVGTFPLPPPSAPRLVFDSFDANAAYWRSANRAGGYANEIALTEYRYLQEADAVVAASSVLADKARALGAQGQVHHIPNGVDLRRFDGLDPEPVRRGLAGDGTLVGSLANYDQPQELDRILDAAKLLAGADVTFLIAGRGSALRHARRRVVQEDIANVRFMGFVPPDRAPALISAFDVGLCAYARSPMDDARTPMRLLMYAAAGLPTVCTDLEEVRRMSFDNVSLVADDAASLADGVLHASELPRARPSQVAAYDLPGLVARYEAVIRG
jgi:glycosyltransferase involved in cell wall biosynthesis